MRDFDELADELYAVPPAEFITARDDAVAQAKGSDKGLARKVGALGKPTLAAWTVNTLVRQAGDQVQELVSLGELLRDAQDTLDPDAMRALGKQRQQVVRALAREAARLARRAGHPVSDSVTTQVEETLKAAVADPAAAEQVLAGRLTGALAYNGLGTPEPAPAGTSARPPDRPATRTRSTPGTGSTGDDPPPPPVDLDAARSAKADRAARREAEERLRAARGELRAARTALDEAAGEAEQATAATREADQAAAAARTARTEADARVEELAAALAKARERATGAAEDAATATADAARAETDRLAAEQELQRATEERDRAQEKVDELS